MKVIKAKWKAIKPSAPSAGVEFWTKREALEFARQENRRHNSGYVVKPL